LPDTAHSQIPLAMGTTLAQLDQFAHTLPATIQQSVAGVHDEEQAMQQNVAAMADDVKNLQSGLNGDEKTRLMQAVTDPHRVMLGRHTNLQ